MSYESKSVFSKSTPLNRVREVVQLLGYKKVKDELKTPNCTDYMVWYEESDYKSWVGIELSIFKEKDGIAVYTRSRAGRSYWDLVHQNKTLKMLRDLFGGHFVTDAGRNRYWRPEDNPPLPVMSGCYLARWSFHNALVRPRVYIQQRKIEWETPRIPLKGIQQILDSMNPLLFSNNLLLPYLVAIWEEYYKSSFIVLLKYSDHQQISLRKTKLSHMQLEDIVAGNQDFEQALADTLSFQRPSNISNNFKMINPELDIGSALREPYGRRKISLYESIEMYVEMRNQFVHTGVINISISDDIIKKFIDDFEVAIDRSYDMFGKHFHFQPLRDF